MASWHELDTFTSECFTQPVFHIMTYAGLVACVSQLCMPQKR